MINGACQSIVVLSQIVGDQFSMMRLRVNPQIALNSHLSACLCEQMRWIPLSRQLWVDVYDGDTVAAGHNNPVVRKALVFKV